MYVNFVIYLICEIVLIIVSIINNKRLEYKAAFKLAFDLLKQLTIQKGSEIRSTKQMKSKSSIDLQMQIKVNNILDSVIMKTLKYLNKLLLIACTALLLQSCLKDEINALQEEKVAEVEEVQAINFSDDFDWRTTNQTEITVLPNTNAVLYVKSLDSKVYRKVYAVAGKPMFLRITIPSYEKQLTVELAGQTKNLDLLKNQLQVNF